jgi:hypothetical protein
VSITGTGKTISSDLMIRIRRLTKTGDRVNDDYTGKAYLRFVDAHAKMNTMGSRTLIAK